jgi:hypothetical protein
MSLVNDAPVSGGLDCMAPADWAPPEAGVAIRTTDAANRKGALKPRQVRITIKTILAMPHIRICRQGSDISVARFRTLGRSALRE